MADETREGYDNVGDAYADRFAHDLDHKPFDREILDEFAERVEESGIVVDRRGE
jgi:hypothetical protein